MIHGRSHTNNKQNTHLNSVYICFVTYRDRDRDLDRDRDRDRDRDLVVE
jgi:hypothetical protein